MSVDKEKLIEEMAKDLEDCIIYSPKRNEYNDYILDYNTIVKRLVEKGWIKPNKDSVVLSREEYVKKVVEEYEAGIENCKFHYEYIAIPHIAQVIKDKPDISDVEVEELIEQLGVEINEKYSAYERGSKETAKKIYKEYLCNILSLEAKEEFAKQFGVEIKEN